MFRLSRNLEKCHGTTQQLPSDHRAPGTEPGESGRLRLARPISVSFRRTSKNSGVYPSMLWGDQWHATMIHAPRAFITPRGQRDERPPREDDGIHRETAGSCKRTRPGVCLPTTKSREWHTWASAIADFAKVQEYILRHQDKRGQPVDARGPMVASPLRSARSQTSPAIPNALVDLPPHSGSGYHPIGCP